MPPAIRAENLGKSYRVGLSASPRGYRTLRETLAAAAGAPLRRLRGRGEADDAKFWALKGVDLEIQPGEVVGIIGRNGSGKSTLLRILSRITRPTTGRVELRGRVGSLLEVGTGFHPELTGRENVYLNGSILGMRRSEIAVKFDEIVAFAEIGQFLDTPVKRYSSGMYVRLAFAVAAHLEPEILIVDEVLAVGDAEFQRKCLGKMHEVAVGGRTVFFVSHHMESVRRLCTTAVWLEEGRVKARGEKGEVISSYLATGPGVALTDRSIGLEAARRTGNGRARFVALSLAGGVGNSDDLPTSDGPLRLALTIESDAARKMSSLAASFSDRSGTRLVNADTLENGELIRLDEGANVVILSIESLHLKEGTYGLSLWLAHGEEVYDYLDDVVTIDVVDPRTDRHGVRPPCDGPVTCKHRLHIINEQ